MAIGTPEKDTNKEVSNKINRTLKFPIRLQNITKASPDIENFSEKPMIDPKLDHYHHNIAEIWSCAVRRVARLYIVSLAVVELTVDKVKKSNRTRDEYLYF